MSPARMEALHGQLWNTGRLEDLELYHRIRKVEPLDRALLDLRVRCWASGVRGRQTEHRKAMEPLQRVRGSWALRPLLDWTRKDVFYYMQEHDLPQHPLFEQGYSTVGDWHSSAPDDGGLSGRATRFGGLKQECGIHLHSQMGEGI
jgi:phosphoadenosine phosphosulfate reductase